MTVKAPKKTTRAAVAPEPLMTPQQLAAYIGVPVQTLANWRYRNDGPRWLKVGRHVRYAMADIERWLDQNAQGGDVA